MGSFKRKVALPIIIFTLSILVVVSVTFFKKSKVEPVDSVKQKAVTYLATKGYKIEEYNLDVLYRKYYTYGGPYVISVIFDDEPDVIYYYDYMYNGNSKLKEITQGGMAPLKDKNDKNFKHAEIK